MELSRSSWVITSLSPGAGEKMSRHSTAANDLPGLLELFAKLKNWRYHRAVAEKLPAFYIAHDSVLEELARRKPQTAQALLGVKGFGVNKLDKYGSDLLAILTTEQ